MAIARSRQGRVPLQARPVVEEPVQADIAQFGGGPGAAGVTQQAVGLSRQAAQFAQNQINDANKLAVTNFDNRLAEKRLEIEKRELQTKGLNALGSTERAEEEFRKFASELSKDAQGNVQRDALAQIVEKRSLQIQESTDRHTVGEIEKEKVREYQARELTLMDSAATHWSDGERLAEDWFDYIDTQDEEIERQGLGAESAKAFRLVKSSEFHSVILNKMIEEEQHEEADAYLDFVMEETPGLTQSALAAIKTSIEESQFRGDAQQKTDVLLEKFTEWPERFDAAKKIKDPKQRDEVRRRLKDERALQKSLEDEAMDEIYTQALNDIEANPRVPVTKTVPSNIWSKLSLSARNGLLRHKESFDPNKDTMDWQAFENFYNLSPTKLAKMTFVELQTKFISKFDRSRQKSAISRWTSTKDAARKGALRIGGRSDNQIIMNRLRKMKYITEFGDIDKAKDQPKLDIIMPGIEVAIEAFKVENNFAPTEPQLNQIVDKLLLTEIRKENTDVFGSAGTGLVTLEEATADIPTVRIKQMSPSDVQQIITKVRKARPNFNFNPDNADGRLLIRRIGAAIRLNNKQLADDLIKGRVK